MEEVSRKKAKCNEDKQFTSHGVPKNGYKDGQELSENYKELSENYSTMKKDIDTIKKEPVRRKG